MSEAMRLIYEKRDDDRIARAVHNLDSNRKLRARMLTNGEKFKRRHKNDAIE